MVIRWVLVFCLAMFAGPILAQDPAPVEDFDTGLELVLDPRDTQPLEGEMMLATIRGQYRETINNEDLKLRRMTDFDWIQLMPDAWSEQSIDGLPTVVFERRIGLFPKRSGSLTVLPIAHELDVMNRANRRQLILVRSEPVTVDVEPKPAEAGSDWLPVKEIEISDTWSTNPAILIDGANVERRVVLRALGVPPELLPSQPELREQWLITFTPPEERTVQLTPEGPVSTAVWVWYLRPITGAPGVIPQVDIPYFDTKDRTAKFITVPSSPIGYASFTNNSSKGWQSGFKPSRMIWAGFFFGIAAAACSGHIGRRFSASIFRKVQLWLRKRLKLARLRKFERDQNITSFRNSMSEYLLSETSLSEAERLEMTRDLDLQIFADRPAAPKATMSSARSALGMKM